MGEINNKFLLKVELFQSLKKGESEAYRDFSQRVNAAVEVLRTTFMCACSALEMREFVKILFVAGLKPQETAQCYENAGDDLEDMIGCLEGQQSADQTTNGAKKQLYQLINYKETTQNSSITSSHNQPTEQPIIINVDPRKRSVEGTEQVIVFPTVKVEQALEELDSAREKDSEQMEGGNEHKKAKLQEAETASEEIEQQEKCVEKEVETACKGMEGIDEQERDLIATEEQYENHDTTSKPEYFCLSSEEIIKKISQHKESLKASVWRAMQKAAGQSDEGVKTHTTPAGETFFSCNFCPSKFATKQHLECHGRYCSKSKQNTIQV